MSGYPPTGSSPPPDWQPGPYPQYGNPQQSPHLSQQPGFPPPKKSFSRGSLGCIFGVLFVLGLSAAGCCGGGVLLFRSIQGPTLESPIAENDQQRQQRLIVGFNADPQLSQHADFSGIDRLMKRARSASKNGNSVGILDGDLLYREMAATGKMEAIPRFGRKFFMSSILVDTEVFNEFDKYVIASIVPIEGTTDEAIVHVHLATAEHQWRKALYVVRKDNDWKIYDWCEVGQNVRKSLELAVINGDDSVAKYKAYNDFFNNINTAFQQEEPSEIQRWIRKAEPVQIYPELHDHMWVILAGYWCDFEKPAEAQRCLDQISQKESPADAVYFQAICCYLQADYDRALELFNRYEELTGNCLNTKQWRADIRLMLDQQELARDEYQAILEIDPDHSCIDDFARLISFSNLEDLVAIIRKVKVPLEVTERFGTRFRDWEFYTGLQRLASLAAELNSDCATTDFLRGLVLDMEEDNEPARLILSKAIKRAVNAENADSYSYYLRQNFIRNKELLQLYQESEDKDDVFQQAYWEWEDGMEVDAVLLSEIARQHLLTHPEDELAQEVAMLELAANKQYDQIIAMNPDVSQDDYGFFLVLEAYVNAGKEREALQKIKPIDQVFPIVSRALRTEKAFARLESLLSEFSDSVDPRKIKAAKQDGWQSFYKESILAKAAVLQHNNQLHEALATLSEAIPDFENDWQSYELKTERLQLLIDAGEAADDWLVYQGDQVLINSPDNFYGVLAAITWDEVDDMFNDLFRQRDFDSARKLLSHFVEWEQIQPRMKMMGAEMWSASNNHSAANALLSDRWLDQFIASLPQSESDPVQSTVADADFNGGNNGNELESAYSLIAKTSRLSGDLVRANKYADLLAEKYDLHDAQLQLACLQLNVPRTAELIKTSSTGLFALRQEPDVLSAFRLPMFDPIRREHPEYWSSDLFDVRTILLFDHPVSMDAPQIKKLLNEHLSDVSWMEQIAAVETSADTRLCFRSGALLVQISVGSQPLKFHQFEILSTAETRLLKEHAAWIAIETWKDSSVERFNDQQADELEQTIGKLFLDLQPAALCRDWGAIFASSDIEQFFDPKFKSQRFYDLASSRNVDYYVDDERQKLTAQEFAKLCEAAVAMSDEELKKLKLEIAFNSASTKHLCEAQVYRVKPGSYGSIEFYVELMNPDPLLAAIRGRDRYFRVQWSSITDWKLE
jgi:hypothetical protein